MKMRVCLPLLLMSSVALAAQEPARSTSPSSERRLASVEPYLGTLNCNFDRIMIGPSGTEIAAWMNDRRYILGSNMIPPELIVVGRMHDPAKAAAAELFAVRAGPQRMLPIRWTREGRLLLRVHEKEQRLLSADADGGTATEEGAIDPHWRQISFTAVSHGDASLLRQPSSIAKIRRVDGTKLIRGAAALGRRLDLAATRYPDLELVRVTKSGIKPLGLNAGQTRLLKLLPDATAIAGGLGYLGAPRRGERSYMPYQQPLIDLASGKLAGKFGPAAIALDRPGRLARALGELERRLKANGSVIIDASASGTVVAAIALAANGDRRLVRVSAAGVQEQPLCAWITLKKRLERPKPPYPLAGEVPPSPVRLRIATLDSSGRETPAEGLPILQYSHAAPAAKRDVVLDFHGGPGASIADQWFPAAVRRLVTPQRDVVEVEYSGSLGGGPKLTRRLAERGMAALAEDADMIAAWLKRQGYRRVYVIGGSFGSVPALMLLKRHRQLVAGSFFSAPLLRLRDPAAWAQTGSGLSKVSPVTQIAYEHAYFGGADGRRRFASDLESLVASAGLGPNDRFYFGGLDQMSKPEHLPAGLSPRQVIPKKIHAAMDASEIVWAGILEHMK